MRFKNPHKYMETALGSCVELPSLNFHLVFFPADEAARERESERLGQLKKSGTPARKLGGLKKGQVTGWRQKVLYIIIYKLQPEC